MAKQWYLAVVFCCCFAASMTMTTISYPNPWTIIEDWLWPLSSINLRFYFRSNYTYVQVNQKNSTDLLKYMDLSKCTILHCHGYNNTADSPNVVAITEAYLDGYDCNILVADYRYVTYRFYVSSVLLVSAVAKVLVHSIEHMVANGMNRETFILSGHSLGSQIAGQIGRDLSFTVSQILAMDPAGPLFGFPEPTINAADARCVKCIHSDMGYAGTVVPCGHQDYYPNGGVRIQPGCPMPTNILDMCSHIRSGDFIRESALHPNSVLAIRCDSWDDFRAGKCDGSSIIPLGKDGPCNVTGKFYFQSNANCPLGRGSLGTVYKPFLSVIGENQPA
ncbi:lipase member H-like [Augochlora pura]